MKHPCTFRAFGKSARFDLSQNYQSGTWHGLLEGVPAEARRGTWTMELTGGAWIYQDNDGFPDGRHREQEPMWSVESHLIHTLARGLWPGGSLGFDTGGHSTADGVQKNVRRNPITWALTPGVPRSRQIGIKFYDSGSRTPEDGRTDLDPVAAAISFMW